MELIPVVNCQDFDCVRSRIEIAQGFLCDHGSESRSGDTQSTHWIHVDIADGGFTNGYATWRNPADLKNMKIDEHVRLEAHLMLNEPELVLSEWLEAGVGRVIVHLETTTSIDTIVNMCAERGVEVWLALGPQMAAEKAFPYLALVKGCQVLAVHPGLPGQQMEPGTLEKIAALRAQFPQLPIEVDGGVSEQTIRSFAQAGATQVVAGSAIFGAEDPVAAYKQLSEMVY